MPRAKSANDPLKRYCESIADKSLRHYQWISIRSNLIRSGMQLTKQNVARYAKFRKLAPRKHITLAQREAYQDFINGYGSRTDFTGIELIEIVQQLYPLIRCRHHQIRKRFYAVGLNCDRNSIYSFQDACKAVASTLLYTPKSKS